MTIAEAFMAIEQAIAFDPGGRGVAPLVCSGDLLDACQRLRGARRVLLVTGFYIANANACETDGPPGAMALAAALRQLSLTVAFASDAPCAPTLQSMGLAPMIVGDDETPTPKDYDVLVAIERVGRAADGRRYNMMGTDITHVSAALDAWFLHDSGNRPATIGVGDGGNEIGMGRVHDAVRAHVPRGEKIASVVGADALVAAGTSNWGAWGLAAGLSLLASRDLLPTSEDAHRAVDAAIDAGAVDGRTARREPTVDALPPADYVGVLDRLRGIVAAALGATD